MRPIRSASFNLLSASHTVLKESNSIRDKNGDKPLDLVPADDTETRGHFRAHAAQTSISNADIADDDDDDGKYTI